MYYNIWRIAIGKFSQKAFSILAKEVAQLDNNQERTPAPRKKRKRRTGSALKTVVKVFGTLMVIGILTVLMFFGIFMKTAKKHEGIVR